MSVVGIARNQLDKIIIAPLIGFEILGNYALTFQIYVVLLIFSNVIYRYALPQDSSGESTRKIKIIGVSYAIVISILGFTIFPLVIPLIFEEFTDVGPAIQIMSLSVIPTTITLFYTSKFLGKEKSSVILTGTIIQCATTIIALIILAPLYGIVGATSAFVISSVMMCVFLVSVDYYKKYKQKN
tara:strand:- start:224 stop:775 length:552 start_codon:yes stop_codon:yes gene_type:complete